MALEPILEQSSLPLVAISSITLPLICFRGRSLGWLLVVQRRLAKVGADYSAASQTLGFNQISAPSLSRPVEVLNGAPRH